MDWYTYGGNNYYLTDKEHQLVENYIRYQLNGRYYEFDANKFKDATWGINNEGNMNWEEGFDLGDRSQRHQNEDVGIYEGGDKNKGGSPNNPETGAWVDDAAASGYEPGADTTWIWGPTADPDYSGHWTDTIMAGKDLLDGVTGQVAAEVTGDDNYKNWGTGNNTYDAILKGLDTIFNGSRLTLGRETNEANKEMNTANNDLQRELTRETNAQNLQIANQNIDLQRETNAQNEALMREQWAREDNSYQRTVNDMASAGLSPLAMSGLNSAGSVVSQTAPQNMATMQSATTTAGHNEMLQGFDMLGGILGIMQAISNIKGSNAQARKTEEEIHSMHRENRAYDSGAYYTSNLAKDWYEYDKNHNWSVESKMIDKQLKMDDLAFKKEQFAWQKQTQTIENIEDALFKLLGTGVDLYKFGKR